MDDAVRPSPVQSYPEHCEPNDGQCRRVLRLLRIRTNSGQCALCRALDKAHVRRKFYEIHVALASPIAAEALERIGRLYGIEDEIRGRPPDKRRAVRQARAGPELESLHLWLQATVTTLSKKSELAQAIRYALSNWIALTRYRDDGRLEADNNAAERALRAVALGRKNWLFAGSDDGGERAAAIYTLLGTAKLNELNPESYLRYVLERIPEHPINRIEELLPWNVLAKLPSLRLAA
jgi:transposase